MMQYSEPVSPHGDIMTRESFIEAVQCGLFIDYDGYGHPIKGDKMDGRFYIYPSMVHAIPEDCTHIIWFNR